MVMAWLAEAPQIASTRLGGGGGAEGAAESVDSHSPPGQVSLCGLTR